MSEPSFHEKSVGRSFADFTKLPPEQRGPLVRGAIRDLNAFLDAGAPLDARRAPARTLELARSLFDAVRAESRDASTAATLDERIVTDEWVRQEADRDQNV